MVQTEVVYFVAGIIKAKGGTFLRGQLLNISGVNEREYKRKCTAVSRSFSFIFFS